MPYAPEHKAKTRARIIESARVLFNRHGFDQVSIDRIMEHAGLTRGGFYHHFASKDELYAEAVKSFTSCNPFARHVAECPEKPPPIELARMLVELYLSDEVLRDVDRHCPLIALPSDVARAGLEPRAAYTDVMEHMAAVFAAAFPGERRVAREKALVIVSLCVGGMVIARTTQDAELRRELRAAARRRALALLDAGGGDRARGRGEREPI